VCVWEAYGGVAMRHCGSLNGWRNISIMSELQQQQQQQQQPSI